MPEVSQSRISHKTTANFADEHGISYKASQRLMHLLKLYPKMSSDAFGVFLTMARQTGDINIRLDEDLRMARKRLKHAQETVARLEAQQKTRRK